jgi:hypothetical protein
MTCEFVNLIIGMINISLSSIEQAMQFGVNRYGQGFLTW